MSIINHVTLQKIVAHDFRYDPRIYRPLGRTRRRGEDNIKVDVQEVGFADMDWIELAQNMDRCRALASVMNLRAS